MEGFCLDQALAVSSLGDSRLFDILSFRAVEAVVGGLK